MTLTDRQYQELALQATGYADAGVATVGVDLGFDTFCVSFDVETDGYREDDYYNGTGGAITTSAACRVIDYDRTLLVDDDTVVPVDFDTDRFERMVEKLLIT